MAGVYGHQFRTRETLLVQRILVVLVRRKAALSVILGTGSTYARLWDC